MVVVLTYILRFVLAGLTFHSDLTVFAFAGKLITVDGHWLDFYNHSVTYQEGVAKLFPHQLILNYQPLAYILPSLVYLPFFSILRATALPLVEQSGSVITHFFNPVLIIYKLPFLIADLSIFYFIAKLFNSPSAQKKARLLWALNPLAIFVSSLVGQIDIVLTLFLLLSLISLKNKHYPLSALYFVVSLLTKPAILIILPFYLFYLYKISLKSLFRFIASFAVSCTIFLLPYFASPIYRYYALFASQLTKTVYAGISIASGTDIPWFFIFFSISALFFITKRLTFFKAISAALLSSLAFTHFHPQWLVWITPLLIYFAIKEKQILPYLFTIAAWVAIVLSFDPTLNVNLFLFTKKLTSLPYQQLIITASILGRAWLVAYLTYLLLPSKADEAA